MTENRNFPEQPKAGAPGHRNAAEGDDPDLDRELLQLSETWSAGEAPEPPDLVDQAVLNAARRAVIASQRRRLGWFGGLATASVVVLTVVIVMQQNGHAPAPEETLLRDVAPAAPGPAKMEHKPQRSADAATSAVAEPEFRELAPRRLESPPDAAPAMATKAAEASDEDAELDLAGSVERTVLPADLWLQRLEAMRVSATPEEFEEELAAFRTTYPDYPLPPGWLP